MKLPLIVTAVAMAAGSAPASAQVQPFAAAGIVIPAGSVAEPDEALPFGDAGLGLQVDGGLAFGMQRGAVDLRIFGTYASMGRDFDSFNREMDQNGIDLELDGTVRVLGGGVGAAYYFPAELLRDVFPYVLASGGVYQQRQRIDYRGEDVVPGTESDVERQTRIGAAAGAGLVWAPGRIRIFLESRVQALMSSGDRPGYLIPVQLGLKFGPS